MSLEKTFIKVLKEDFLEKYKNDPNVSPQYAELLQKLLVLYSIIHRTNAYQNP